MPPGDVDKPPQASDPSGPRAGSGQPKQGVTSLLRALLGDTARDGARPRPVLRALALAENAVLVVLLGLLVVLAGGQIVLRQLDVALAWGDP